MLVSRRQVYKLLSCLCLIILTLRLQGIITFDFILFDSGKRFSVRDLNIWEWYRNSTIYCGGNCTVYGHRFFKLNYAYLNPSESDHFAIRCKNKDLPSKESMFGNYATALHVKNLRHMDLTNLHVRHAEYRENLVIVVNREYPHNFYHAMTQWFNIFVLSVFFKFEFRKVDILLLDNSPAVHLDVQWATLFANVTKVKHLNTPVIFREAIFSIPGHESPMYYMDQTKMQYVDDFSTEYLNIFGLKSNKILDCSHLTIVLAVRKDYFWHLGEGTFSKRNTERKYKNEDEILKILHNEFKGHTIKTFIAENMSLNKQLAIMTNTDILIGMHGCIMTHAMFMPRHAAIFEMYPKFWKPQKFFRAIAKWRGLHYDYWRNEDKWNEFVDHYTRVPPEVIANYSRKIKNQLCGQQYI